MNSEADSSFGFRHRRIRSLKRQIQCTRHKNPTTTSSAIQSYVISSAISGTRSVNSLAGVRVPNLRAEIQLYWRKYAPVNVSRPSQHLPGSPIHTVDIRVVKTRTNALLKITRLADKRHSHAAIPTCAFFDAGREVFRLHKSHVIAIKVRRIATNKRLAVALEGASVVRGGVKVDGVAAGCTDWGRSSCSLLQQGANDIRAVRESE